MWLYYFKKLTNANYLCWTLIRNICELFHWLESLHKPQSLCKGSFISTGVSKILYLLRMGNVSFWYALFVRSLTVSYGLTKFSEGLNRNHFSLIMQWCHQLLDNLLVNFDVDGPTSRPVREMLKRATVKMSTIHSGPSVAWYKLCCDLLVETTCTQFRFIPFLVRRSVAWWRRDVKINLL